MRPTFLHYGNKIGHFPIRADLSSGSSGFTWVCTDPLDPSRALISKLLKLDYSSPTTQIERGNVTVEDILRGDLERGRHLQKCPGVITPIDTVRCVVADDGVNYSGFIYPCAGDHKKILAPLSHGESIVDRIPYGLDDDILAQQKWVPTKEAIAFNAAFFGILANLHEYVIPGASGPTLHGDINGKNVLIERDFASTLKGVWLIDAGMQITYSALQSRPGAFISPTDFLQQEIYAAADKAYARLTRFDVGYDIFFGTRNPQEIDHEKKRIYAEGKRVWFKEQIDKIRSDGNYTPVHEVNPAIHRDYDAIVLHPGLTPETSKRYKSMREMHTQNEQFWQLTRPKIFSRASDRLTTASLEERMTTMTSDLTESIDNAFPYPPESFSPGNFPWAMNRKNGTFYTGKPTDHSSPYFVWLCAVLHRSTGKDWYRDLAIAKGGEIIDAFPQMTKTPTALGLSGSIVGTTLFELTKKKEYLDFMEKCARTVVRDHGRWTQDGNHFYMTQNFIGYPRVSCILSSLYRTGSVLWQTVRYRGKFKKELASMAKFYLDRLSQIEIGRDPEFFRPEKRLSAADTTERAFENRLGFRRNSTDFRERFLSADFAKTVFAARNIARVITDGSIDFKPAYDSLLNLGKKHRWTIPFDTVDEGLRFNNTGYGVRQDIGGTAWSLLAFATLDDSDQIDKENPSRCLAQKLLAPQVASTTHNIFLGVPQLAINGLRDVHTSVDTDAVGLHALLATSGRKDILDGIDFI